MRSPRELVRRGTAYNLSGYRGPKKGTVRPEAHMDTQVMVRDRESKGQRGRKPYTLGSAQWLFTVVSRLNETVLSPIAILLKNAQGINLVTTPQYSHTTRLLLMCPIRSLYKTTNKSRLKGWL